jgi:hypothetical protein
MPHVACAQSCFGACWQYQSHVGTAIEREAPQNDFQLLFQYVLRLCLDDRMERLYLSSAPFLTCHDFQPGTYVYEMTVLCHFGPASPGGRGKDWPCSSKEVCNDYVHLPGSAETFSVYPAQTHESATDNTDACSEASGCLARYYSPSHSGGIVKEHTQPVGFDGTLVNST